MGRRLFLVPTWESVMAHRGPAPSARKLGRTPNAEWVDVPDVPYEGASPDLPKLKGRQKWHEIVVQWWENVRRMPHCALWRPTDWDYALETALMKQRHYDRFMEGEEKTTDAVEIRRREDNLGTTQESLRKLRIRYVPVEVQDELDADEPDEQPRVVHQSRAGGPGRVTSLQDRRARARTAMPGPRPAAGETA
jgi:hypothetical protein